MTMLAEPLYRARRIPAAEFQDLVAAEKAGKAATNVLAEAQAKADQLVQSAREEAAEIIAAARAMAEAEAQAVTVEHDRRRAAREMRKGLDAAARIEARFDALSPWFERLALRLAEKVVGSFEPEERHRLVLAEALASSRPTGDLRLRVHPGDMDAADAAARTLGARIAVVSDEQLPLGSCVLDCEDGQFDLSVAAQVEALCDEIAEVLRQEGCTE